MDTATVAPAADPAPPAINYATHGELIEPNKTGDTKVIWDRANPDEVEAARATFDRLKRKGYAAFAVKGDGAKGDQIREFDPAAERIIMALPLVGG